MPSGGDIGPEKWNFTGFAFWPKSFCHRGIRCGFWSSRLWDLHFGLYIVDYTTISATGDLCMESRSLYGILIRILVLWILCGIRFVILFRIRLAGSHRLQCHQQCRLHCSTHSPPTIVYKTMWTSMWISMSMFVNHGLYSAVECLRTPTNAYELR